MKLTKITSALTALALGAVLSTSAHAQISYSQGDILLGFEQGNGSGGVTANNYIVDLGAASQFITATAGTSLTFNLNTTDLSNAFGSGWANNTPAGSLVQWGLVGGSNNSASIVVGGVTLKKNTLFESSPGLKPTTLSSSGQGTINSNIQNFATGFTLTAGLGANSGVGASGGANSWSSYTPSTSAFASGYNFEQPAAGFGNDGPTNSTLTLWQLNNTTSTPGATAIDLGTFGLSSAGVLTFNAPAAVPEPSSFALGSVAFALMVVLIARQRKSVSVE